MFFAIGDYLGSALIGAVTAFAVRLLVAPGMDMVIAMLLGMGLGMIVHLVVGFVLAPLLGMFETMMPATFTGMYGGMLFAMRDSMAAGSQTMIWALAVGAGFGIVVMAAMNIYNRALRGPVLEADV
jgi:hypothetical protein